MLGMGLLRRRGARDVNEPSAEALAALDVLGQAAESGQDKRVVVEGGLGLGASLLHQEDALAGFRQLEALDMLVEQHEDLVAGVPEGARAHFLRLLMALWVNAARALAAKQQLNATTVPNWKYVLRRAVATGEQLAESWQSDAEAAGTGQALDVLQAMVDGTDDSSQGEGDGSQYDAQAQLQAYAQQVPGGLQALPQDLASTLKQQVRGTKPEEEEKEQAAKEEEEEDEEEEEEDEAGDDDEQQQGGGGPPGSSLLGLMPGGTTEEDLQQLQLMTRQLASRTGTGGGLLGEDEEEEEEEEEGGLGQRGGGEDQRLMMLDDLSGRPVLLRVVGRLPPDHPLRQEVEQEVGARVGTGEWEGLVAQAQEEARAAGLQLPERPASAASGAVQQQRVGAGAGGGGVHEVGGGGRGSKRSHGLMVNPPPASVGFMDDGGLRSLEGVGNANSPSLSLMSFGTLVEGGGTGEAEGGGGGGSGAGGWASSKRRVVRASDSRLELVGGMGLAGDAAGAGAGAGGVAGLVSPTFCMGDEEGGVGGVAGLLDLVTNDDDEGVDLSVAIQVPGGGYQQGGGKGAAAAAAAGGARGASHPGAVSIGSMASMNSLVLLPPSSTSTAGGGQASVGGGGVPHQQQQQSGFGLPGGGLWGGGAGAGAGAGEELSWNQSVDGMLLGEPGEGPVGDALRGGAGGEGGAGGAGAGGATTWRGGVARMPSLAMLTAGKGAAGFAGSGDGGAGLAGIAGESEWLAQSEDMYDQGGAGEGLAWDVLGGDGGEAGGGVVPGSPVGVGGGGAGGGGGVKRGNSFIMSPALRAVLPSSKLSRMT